MSSHLNGFFLPSLYALGNGLNFFSRFINLASISPSLEARKNYHFSISNELNGINQFCLFAFRVMYVPFHRFEFKERAKKSSL
jgi:hypothetical protein